MTRDETISDYSKKQCIYGQGKLNTFLFGDSHSSSVATALGEAARESGYSMVLWGLDSCPTVLNSSLKVLSRDRLCKDFNQKGLDILDSFNKKMNVVIVNRTAVFTQGANEVRSNPNIFERLFASKSEEVNGYLDKKQKEEFLRDIVETACQIQKKHQVYLVRPIPEMGVNIPQRLSRDMILGKFYADFVIPRSDYLYRTNDVWLAQQTAAMNCGVKVLDTAAYLCDDNECMGSIKGRPLYYDDDHLSEYGNKLLIPMFKNIYVDLED